MDMMLLRITTFFHAIQPLVYPIFFNLHSITFTSTQEENDQAFSIAL
jgi:hypothetical protein